MAKDFVQMDLLAWGGVHPEQGQPDQTPFDEPEEFTDGITPDRFESIVIALPKKIRQTVKVSLAQGDSGDWYCGISVWTPDEGMGYAAWPKFSDVFNSKYEAFDEARIKAIDWFTSRKVKKEHVNAINQQLLNHLQGINPSWYHRDRTCGEWRSCGYANKCFGEENELDEAGPVCFKEEEIKKGKEAAEKSLLDLCKECHESTCCSLCCATCQNPCNAKQRCKWPGAKEAKI